MNFKPRHCLCAALLLLPVTIHAELRLKRVAFVPRGANYGDYGRVICADTDHDGLYEVIYGDLNGGGPSRPCWEIMEYRPFNRYEVVKSDTGIYPYPPDTVATGFFLPCDAGDVDRDGRSDLVGVVPFQDGDSMRLAVCTIESQDSASYPAMLNWYHGLPGPFGGWGFAQYADLDRDSATEILVPYGRTMVFENVGDNRESLVYNSPPSAKGWYPVADFDGNGRTDYACDWDAKVRICECVGDNQYQQVCSLDLVLQGSDYFSGTDVDQNGKPEFFMVDAWRRSSRWWLYLYMFEATAEHEYAFWLVDSEWIGTGTAPASSVSLCADLDGDGVEEIIWACGTHGYILKTTGPHQFRRELLWLSDNGPSTLCNACDMNGNGYEELLVGGCGMTSVLEVEPVRVMYPYHREVLVAGDTCLIRWRIYTPPRCDSVSLFLKTDTTIYPGERFWRLDTIATGLAPTESSYSWVVPDTQLAWVKVLAIAYGPGWQYDESNSASSIIPSGLVDQPRVIVRDWALSASPNPAVGRATVRWDIPRIASVRVCLYGPDGRVAKGLMSGEVGPGRYAAEVRTSAALPPGVYFCTLDNGTGRISSKLVLTE